MTLLFLKNLLKKNAESQIKASPSYKSMVSSCCEDKRFE